jgi:hypothetical protein
MEFCDVRIGRAIVSSHKTLRKACVVQQKATSDRRVVLTSLDGTKWCDLREYSAAECRKAVQDVTAKHFRCRSQLSVKRGPSIKPFSRCKGYQVKSFAMRVAGPKCEWRNCRWSSEKN